MLGVRPLLREFSGHARPNCRPCAMCVATSTSPRWCCRNCRSRRRPRRKRRRRWAGSVAARAACPRRCRGARRRSLSRTDAGGGRRRGAAAGGHDCFLRRAAGRVLRGAAVVFLTREVTCKAANFHPHLRVDLSGLLNLGVVGAAGYHLLNRNRTTAPDLAEPPQARRAATPALAQRRRELLARAQRGLAGDREAPRSTDTRGVLRTARPGPH